MDIKPPPYPNNHRKNIHTYRPEIKRAVPNQVVIKASKRKSLLKISTYLKPATIRISLLSRSLRYLVIILALLFLSAIPWLSNLVSSVNAYNLSHQALAIINKPNNSLDSSTIFNNNNQTFTINPDGLKPSASAYPSYLVGQPNTGLYSATLPTNLDNGIAITNNSNHIAFTLKPQFSTSLGRHINGHFIYPLGTGAIQAVYTAKSTELSEDIVINKNVGNVLSFPYKLQLPQSFKAFNLAAGAIGIEGAGNISFQLSNPTITQSNNNKISQTNKNSPSAKLVLTKNNQLTLLATNLNKLSYPITIDPSVTINSTNNFLTGNDEGGNNITTNQVSTGQQTGGALNNTIASCPSGWTLNSSTYCTNTASLPTATYDATSIVYNGYVYEIGGNTTAATATVDYAPLNSSGTIGTWTATTNLPVATYYATSVVYNGYVYEIGGQTPSSTATVDYAPINSNGTLGAWNATTSLPVATEYATSVVYNGYVYEIGGYTGSAATATVDYAPINSNGTLGSWTATTSLPTATYWATSVVYNGYVYEIGGDTGAATATVDYAPINSNGTLGSWTATASLPVATDSATSVVYNGYVYEIGGGTGSGGTATVDYAPINSNGTLGSWTATTSLPTATSTATSVVYNSYVYEIGGCTTSCALATVDYAPIAPAGWVSSPDSTDINTWGATTALPGLHSKGSYYYPYEATSVVYNGYVYEIGGNEGSATFSPTATVDYAPINSNGTLGSWTATTSLPAATQYATSVVYNGYVYEIGGDTTSTTVTVDYALICTGSNSTGGCTTSSAPGSLGSWTATTILPTATNSATSVVYNGFVYEIGGYSTATTVDYALICTGSNSTGGCTTSSAPGSLGTWTATTSLPAPTDFATSVVYNGFVYEIGGNSTTTTVDYALICTGSNSTGGCTTSSAPGSLGTWTATTSLPTATNSATSVIYNGYVYEIGGYTGSSAVATVDYAPINANGTLGSWTATTSLPAATYDATSVVYNGYVYEIGGYNGNAGVATVDYAVINNGGPGVTGAYTATTSLPVATNQAASVVYNGYVYEMGGFTGSATATVDYAPINSNGTLGSWTATTSLPTATEQATSVAYNGYVYEIGGSTTAATSTVDYALICTGSNSGVGGCTSTAGTLGSWTATTSLPAATYQATSVVYNGYVYEIGGIGSATFATVDYAVINANGTLGSWTATTSLPAATFDATSVVYNGYVYEIGGRTTTYVATVDYAPINANGTLGSWAATTSLPAATYWATSVAYDGYVYEIGGENAAGTVLTIVDYAPINTNGSLGTWTATTSLPAATWSATSFVYNGYVYEIGGALSAIYATVDSTPLYSIPRIGNYSMLVNVGGGFDVTPISVIVNGTNLGNPGNGVLSGLSGIRLKYEGSTVACNTFNASNYVNLIPPELSTAYNMTLSTNGCGSADTLGTYIWVHIHLDDTQTATYPDINGNHTTITGFQIFYHPASINRLRGGATFNGGSLQSLDAPPFTKQ